MFNLRKTKQVIATSALAVAVIALGGSLNAADHADSPMAAAEPAADINDLFAWTAPDGENLNLIMTVFPNAPMDAKFSNAVQYVFHVNSSEAPGGTAAETRVACRFDEQQLITCRVGDTAMVSGQDASSTSGVRSEDRDFRVFAGLRSDPFFFALDAFKSTVGTVVQAAPQLKFNEAGCPMLEAATQTALGGSLRGTNTFAGMNVLAISVQVKKSLLGPGPIYGVWSSTARVSQ